jgi:hypothetical protein
MTRSSLYSRQLKSIKSVAITFFLLSFLFQEVAPGQTLALTMDTPQPRVNATFQVRIDIGPIREQLFKGLEGSLKIATDASYYDDNLIYYNVAASDTGKFVIGPLNIEINQRTYSTNALSYEVVGGLPTTDKGVWFRKVNIDQNSFYLIIEQHIPMHDTTSHPSKYATLFETVPEDNHAAKFIENSTIPGLAYRQSTSSAVPRTVTDSNGNTIKYADCIQIVTFGITDKSKKIVLNKKYFQDLPKDYHFKDLVIN